MKFTIYYKSNNSHIVEYVINKISGYFNNKLKIKKHAIKDLSDFINCISQYKSKAFYIKYQPFSKRSKYAYTISMKFEVVRNKCNVEIMTIAVENAYKNLKSIEVKSESDISLNNFSPHLEFRFGQFKNYNMLKDKFPEIKLPPTSEVPYIYYWLKNNRVSYAYNSLIIANIDHIVICSNADYVIVEDDVRIYIRAINEIHGYVDREIKRIFGDDLSLLENPDYTIREIKKRKILNVL